jgi:Glutamine synthetase adenylyltransferase
VDDYAHEFAALDNIQEIRRYYLQQMFRLQAESVCLQAPIFPTLERCTQLADAVIQAAYRVAKAEILAPRTLPGDLTVIALGRLGMLEFDLGSDADLVFALPDDLHAEAESWTRVAERTVTLLSSYTGDGVIFSVDTRLRPNGQGGALVQAESAFCDYFHTSAQTWEGLAYMKARAVAGGIERGTRFLEELQRIDWRRHGQVGRSRADLRQMRDRIEREQGHQNPLKNAPGGYYDVDFLLVYLRLRGAGVFYPALNTPKRIEVLEKMGHLDASDARFLLDAAIFYRAVDHGLRLMSGHAEGSLPGAEGPLQILHSLVRRWAPPHLCDQPLAEELRQIQDRTRTLFNRVFS